MIAWDTTAEVLDEPRFRYDAPEWRIMPLERRPAFLVWFVATVLLMAVPALAGKKKPPQPTPLEIYIQESLRAAEADAAAAAPGSLFTPASRLTDLARDLRASQVGDIVTVLVAERATAVTSGQVQSSRSSSANVSIPKLAGIPSPVGGLANGLSLESDVTLDGAGRTSRQTALNTTLTARVVQVMPNGNLIIEGVKNVMVNSENQTVLVRGIVRPNDLTPGNVVRSDRVGEMELRINGKGVVADATRRPNILYRILMGILPF